MLLSDAHHHVAYIQHHRSLKVAAILIFYQCLLIFIALSSEKYHFVILSRFHRFQRT